MCLVPTFLKPKIPFNSWIEKVNGSKANQKSCTDKEILPFVITLPLI